MEDALRAEKQVQDGEEIEVLILVLMEDALRETVVYELRYSRYKS